MSSYSLLSNKYLYRAIFNRVKILNLQQQESFLYSLFINFGIIENNKIIFNKTDNIDLLTFSDRPFLFSSENSDVNSVTELNNLFNENKDLDFSFFQEPPNAVLVIDNNMYAIKILKFKFLNDNAEFYVEYLNDRYISSYNEGKMLLFIDNSIKTGTDDSNVIPPSYIINPGLTSSSVNGLIIVKPPGVVNGNATFDYYKGSNKYVNDTSDLNSFIYELYQYMGQNYETTSEDEYIAMQFSQERYVFLFVPGTYYNVNMLLNYYISYIGGGSTKDEVIFLQSTLIAPPSINFPKLGGLDNFWRSAENFTIDSTNSNYPSKWVKYNEYFSDTVLLSVSQAAPIRNVLLNNTSLYTFQISSKISYASVFCSGGFMSDITFNNNAKNKLNFGGQQQFYSRNITSIDPNSISGGAWNTVFNNTRPESSTNMTGHRVTNSGSINIPLKPFYSISKDSIIDENNEISNFLICNTNTELTVINNALNDNKSIIFTPGYYLYSEPINITKSNTILLSMGMVTIENTTGSECLVINDNLNNVKIAGLIIQATDKSTQITNSLIKVGDTIKNNSNKIYLYDIFIRVGGPYLKPNYDNRVETMVIVNSNNVLLDNFWLWRADHTDTIDQGLGTNNAVCNNALIVNGDNIKAYGLACEHTLEDIVIWNGNNGEVNFYQCELPYDVKEQWDYSGFQINGDNFTGYGMGVYCFFAEKWQAATETFTNQAITITGSSYNLTNIFTVFLDSVNGRGSINSVVYDKNLNQFYGPICDTVVSDIPIWADLPVNIKVGGTNSTPIIAKYKSYSKPFSN